MCRCWIRQDISCVSSTCLVIRFFIRTRLNPSYLHKPIPTNKTQSSFACAGGEGDAADLYAGANGFVVEEPMAALSDEELLQHMAIFPVNLGGGEGGGALATATAEVFAAFGRDVLQAFRSLQLQQHLEAFSQGDPPLLAAGDGSGGSSGSSSSNAVVRTVADAIASPTSAVAAAAAAAQVSTAASIASGVLFQCDKAVRKCKLGRLARSPVSITFYVPPPPAAQAPGRKSRGRRRKGSSFADEDEEEQEQEARQAGDGAVLTREEFFALASASPETTISQVGRSVDPSGNHMHCH